MVTRLTAMLRINNIYGATRVSATNNTPDYYDFNRNKNKKNLVTSEP